VDGLSGSQGKKMAAGVETHLGRFFFGISGSPFTVMCAVTALRSR
jgi:hypothetical protein